MEERFQIYESLFEHPGWDLFLREWITPAVEQVPMSAFENAQRIEEILAARVIRDKLAQIQNMPSIIDAQREEAEELQREKDREGTWQPE